MLRITGFSPKRQDFKDNSQSGSVIVWIFVMIAILAALNFVISQGTRSGANQISEEQAGISATEILNYASSMKNAVQTLKINGCDDTEVSFEQAIVAGYSNSNAPSDNSCHIFHPSGGSLSWSVNSTSWYSTYSAGSGLLFNGETSVVDVGSTASELIMWIPKINKSICNALNERLNNVASSIDVVTSHTTNFQGAYGNLANDIGDAAGNAYSGKQAGCIDEPGDHPAAFYQILIAR